MKDCLLLIGSFPSRDYVLDQVVATAANLGVGVLVLDRRDSTYAQHAQIDGFIDAPIDQYASNEQLIVKKVRMYVQLHQLQIKAVYTPFDAYVELAGVLTDFFDAAGNPLRAVRTAQAKANMREVFAKTPSLAVSYGIARSCAEAAELVEKLGKSCVIKPTRGAGSRGVITDVQSADEARQAWQQVSEHIDSLSAGGKDSARKIEIMVEEQLQGPEVDVELVLQRGEVCFAAVADNPEISLPAMVEKSTTYPSQLPHALQTKFIQCALDGLQHLGLEDGNFHVEIVGTQRGPKIIEVNARMGGAFVWHAFKSAYGVDLIELGIRSLFDDCEVIPARPDGVLEAKFFIAQSSGTLKAICDTTTPGDSCNVRMVEFWKTVNDQVLAPKDKASDYLGFIMCWGANYAEAVDRTLSEMQKISFSIEDSDGQIIDSLATYQHL